MSLTQPCPRALLEAKRLLLKAGTIVDATIVDDHRRPELDEECDPDDTQTRDPELKQTCTGNS
ncbi:MAG: hypothetical protein ABI910_21910 [Gemmatimonadota bacterium]